MQSNLALKAAWPAASFLVKPTSCGHVNQVRNQVRMYPWRRYSSVSESYLDNTRTLYTDKHNINEFRFINRILKPWQRVTLKDKENTCNRYHWHEAYTSDSVEAKETGLKGDFFKIDDLYTLEDLMESRIHLGHKEGMLNPHMRPYIFGKRLGMLIFDLEQTHKLLKKALNVTAEIAYRKGIILFVHQSRQNGHLVEAAAKQCGEYAYCRRWDCRILTEASKVFHAVTRLPDLILLFSALEKINEPHGAVKSAAKMLIPTVGICDTNADPTLVTYMVPGNDDSPQSIELYCKLFKQAVLNGKQRREEIIANYGVESYYKTLDVDEERTQER